MVDCPDHALTGGAGAVLENFLSAGTPVAAHDTTGWPTFVDWPSHGSLTHEQTYYRWIERAWRGGLRIFTNLLVENRVLCELYPLEAQRLRRDGQRAPAGAAHPRARALHRRPERGTGQGVVPHRRRSVRGAPGRQRGQARRRPRHRDLGAVRLQHPARASRSAPRPTSTRSSTSSTRSVCASSSSSTSSTTPWEGSPSTAAPPGPSSTSASSTAAGSGGTWRRATPRTPACTTTTSRCPAGWTQQHRAVRGDPGRRSRRGRCPSIRRPTTATRKGLTALGAHAVQAMVDRDMIVDIDHMSVKARQQALDLLEADGYSGVISSHSWATPDAYPRVQALGGVIAPVRRWLDRLRAVVARPQGDGRTIATSSASATAPTPTASARRAGPRRCEEPGDVPVHRPRGRGDRPAGQRLARLRHQRRRGGPLRPLPRLDRGPADAGRRRDRRGPGPWLRGLPPDVGAGPRHRRSGLSRTGSPRRPARRHDARRGACASPASPSVGPTPRSPTASTVARTSCSRSTPPDDSPRVRRRRHRPHRRSTGRLPATGGADLWPLAAGLVALALFVRRIGSAR